MADGRDAPVVVVTGASAGIGRAAAVLFARRGAHVALFARGEKGLDGARREIEKAGGTAIAIPTDVADFKQVEHAAAKVERKLGPIDTWVNVRLRVGLRAAGQISPEEFRRVTEVSYLGFVHGTMVALSYMKTRDRGTIVQVGSALGERAIPLQSAYCGAKHAINGFTESLRCELLHDRSNVHVTVVQMPAVNTPQFSWVLSRLPRHPQPVPPIYEPEVAARAIVFAAAHPERKQYWVGASTIATLLGQKVMPAVLDRYLARTGFDAQQTDDAAPRAREQPLRTARRVTRPRLRLRTGSSTAAPSSLDGTCPFAARRRAGHRRSTGAAGRGARATEHRRRAATPEP